MAHTQHDEDVCACANAKDRHANVSNAGVYARTNSAKMALTHPNSMKMMKMIWGGYE